MRYNKLDADNMILPIFPWLVIPLGFVTNISPRFCLPRTPPLPPLSHLLAPLGPDPMSKIIHSLNMKSSNIHRLDNNHS